MKTRVHIIVLSLIASCNLNFMPEAMAQENNDTLNFSKAWFKPSLIENKDSVCASLLAKAQADFFSKTSDQPPVYDDSKGPIQNDTNWIFQKQPYAAPMLVNKENLYLREVLDRGCGGACESKYIAVGKIPFTDTRGYGDNLSLNENQVTDSVAAYSSNAGLYLHQNGSYYAITKSETTNAYKLKSNATWEKVCAITSTPDESTFKKISKTYDSIILLSQKVNGLLGEEGATCGSMHTLSRWKNRINKSLPMASYRPWALYEIPNQDSTYAIDIKNLETWSLQDIAQKNAFDEYQKQLSATTKELSDFYQKNYNWSKKQSDDLAYTALTSAISYGIRFYMYDQLNQDQKNLLTAITDKKPLPAIKQLSEKLNALPKTILNISIKNPEALAFFLTKNKTPNEQNEFHKTLLMYAAQYNQLDSAKILLKESADVNLSTIIPEDNCNYTLSKSGMTALHYAVRYASYDFIKLLLDSGAYPYAKTSEEIGGYPIDWLHKYTGDAAQEKNPNLTKEQTVALELLLKLPTQTEITKAVLDYNLVAEQAFSKGQLESAYSNSKKALGLDSSNERTLANLSLISLKMGNPLEALEASNKIITVGKDSNQIANAWFNYGLTCESKNIQYQRYNGNTYCNNYPLFYFLEAYKLKPTPARATKIVSTIKEAKTPNCPFANGGINILGTLSVYGSSKNLYLLKPKNQNVDQSKISWQREKETKSANNTISKVKVSKSPDKLLTSIELGNFTLNTYSSDEDIYTPIQFESETCTNQSGIYTVLPSTKK